MDQMRSSLWQNLSQCPAPSGCPIRICFIYSNQRNEDLLRSRICCILGTMLKILMDWIPKMALSYRWGNWSLEVKCTCGVGRCVSESWLSSPLNSASPTDSSFTVSPLDAENRSCVVLHVTNPTGRGTSYILPQWSRSLELCNHFRVTEPGFGVLGEHGGSWGTTGSQTFCLWILDFRTVCQSPHKLCLLRPRCS